jgi:DNA mismatch repair protein MutS
MEIDDITYQDLSLFSHEEEYSIFHKLDFTRTTGGKDLLLTYFNRPFSRLEPIYSTQQILTLMLQKMDQWPSSISNGTVMVMERFYETPLDDIPTGAESARSAELQNFSWSGLFHGPILCRAFCRFCPGNE